MSELIKQPCPFCKAEELTLIEETYNVPNFGRCFLMSMRCNNCNYYKSDIEAEEKKDPVKITFTVEDKKDLNVRVIKSSEATIKIPQMKMEVIPNIASTGYITNVEGVLSRFKKIIENERDNAEDNEVRKKAKNLLKKLWKVELGDEKLKIIIEDPSGNSAIVSDKAENSKLK